LALIRRLRIKKEMKTKLKRKNIQSNHFALQLPIFSLLPN